MFFRENDGEAGWIKKRITKIKISPGR